LYTGTTANLLWLKVQIEGSSQGLETLISRWTQTKAFP
jgi:hypothetical protein